MGSGSAGHEAEVQEGQCLEKLTSEVHRKGLEVGKGRLELNLG